MKLLDLFVLSFLLVGAVVNVKAQANDSLLSVLDKAIERREDYTQKKNATLKKLRLETHKTRLSGSPTEIYHSYIKLYDGYNEFKYDSAYIYVEKAKQVAHQINDSTLIAEAKIHEGFLLLSAGLFTEAIDTLQSIDTLQLGKLKKYDLYFTKARSFFDLAEYNDDNKFQVNYIRKGISNLRKALALVDKNSSEYLKANGLKHLQQQNWKDAKNNYLTWLKNNHLSPQLYGVATSSLSYIYAQLGEEKKSTYYITLAAISDIKHSIKENIALRNLASKLYEKGELKKANAYVKIALEDADFFNARHRKNQISSILPIIESAQLYKVEQKNKTLENTVVLLAVLSLLILISLGIIFKQLKEKKAAREALTENNKRLQQLNLNLMEADSIKQDYITYFLKATSQLINKMGTLQKSTILKIKTKKPEDVLQTIYKYSAKKERTELFHQFDEVFLQLFPSFINQFNDLFPEDEQKVPKKNELLTTELRIFALYRLGIQDNKQVADFLDVSLSTVYSYKTRLKSKSNYRENFEEKIMQIKKF